MKVIITILLLLVSLSLKAQDSLSLEDKLQMNQYNTWNPKTFKNRVSLNFRVLPATAFGLLSPENFYVYYGEAYSLGEGFFYETGKRRRLFNFGGISLTPRYNIVSKKQYSIFASIPTSFGFSLVTKGKAFRNAGFGDFQSALILGFGKGLRSSNNNVNGKGFSIAAGYQFMTASLMGNKFFHDAYNTNSFEDVYVAQKAWLVPTVQVNFYSLRNIESIRGVSIQSSLGQIFHISASIVFAPRNF